MDSNQDLLPGNEIRYLKDGIFIHPALILDNGFVYENAPHSGEGLTSLQAFIEKTKGKFRVIPYDISV